MIHNFLISLSLFSPIGENTKLEKKYSNLFDLIERMTTIRIKKRPDCEKILSGKKSWALSLSKLLEKLKEKDLEIISKDIKEIEENFHFYFIQTKLKFHENSLKNIFYLKKVFNQMKTLFND